MAVVPSRGGTFLGLDPTTLGDDLSDITSCGSPGSHSNDDSSEDFGSCEEDVPAYPPSTASTSCTYVDALDWLDTSELGSSGNTANGIQGAIRFGLAATFTDQDDQSLADISPLERFFAYTRPSQEGNWQWMLTQQRVAPQNCFQNYVQGVAKVLNAKKGPYSKIQEKFKGSALERNEWEADRKLAISEHIGGILGMISETEAVEEAADEKVIPQGGEDSQSVSQKDQENISMKEGSSPKEGSTDKVPHQSDRTGDAGVSKIVQLAGTSGNEAGIGTFSSRRGLDLGSLQSGDSRNAIEPTNQEVAQDDREKDLEIKRKEAEAKEKQETERQKLLEEQRQAEVKRNEAAREMAAKQAELRAAEARRQEQQAAEARRQEQQAAEEQLRVQAEQLAEAQRKAQADAQKRHEAVQKALAPQSTTISANVSQMHAPSAQPSVSHPVGQVQANWPQSSTATPPGESSLVFYGSESAKQFETTHKERSEAFRQKIGPFESDDAFKKERRVLDKQLKMEINQVSGNLTQVYQKAENIIEVLDGLPDDRRFYAYQSLAQIMMSKCDGLMQNLVFPLAEVLMKVVRKHPLLLDALLSALHKVCVMTVPKYFALKEGVEGEAERREVMKYKQIEEGTGTRNETEDEFVARQSGYIMLFAGLLQVDDGKHASGVNEAWSYLARLLNELPPTRVTATALENFLRISGSKLFYQYQNQMVKLLQFIDSRFLKQLGESGETEVRAIYTRLHTYLSTEKFREEPEGWRMPDRDESSYTQA